jgi:Domain of unknown function (DUF4037)
MPEVAVEESIIDVSRDFFQEIVKPLLERECPAEIAHTTFGAFGYGSEVLRLDDDYSQDHHWGIRINALMPDELYAQSGEKVIRTFDSNLPATYRGQLLREGLAGRGLSLMGLQAYLRRTIGLDHAPSTYAEWLSIPEEDVIHIVNGEVWYDPAGQFSAIRETFRQYYPEPVRRRRIAHWCRYFSGMGTYALKRAILRHNDFYASVTFARAIRLGVQLAFLLDKQYFPYDKWTMAYFERLPRMAKLLHPLVEESVKLSTPWARKLDLLNQMADILDATMVADGIVKPHAKFVGSESSGYRLLEHDYAQIIKDLPDDIKTLVPVTDQIYMERFHSGYVDKLDLDGWDGLLNLRPIGAER